MCVRERGSYGIKIIDALGFSPKIALMVNPVSSSSILCRPVRYTPYRPVGSIDHVPRRPLERGCVSGNGFVACAMWWNRLSPNSRSHRLCLLRSTLLLLCPWADAISVFTPFFASSALLHPLRHDPPPVAGYACKRLIVAAKRMRNASVH